MQLEREDANTSYLTSGRQTRPSPPSLFLPEVEHATATDSVVVSSSHKATLSLSTTPSNAAPTAAVHTKTQLAWLIISVAGTFWQNRTRKKAVKSLSETPLHKIVFGFPAALKSCLSLFHVQSQEAYVRSPQTQKCLVAAFPGKSFSKNNQHTTHKVIQGVTVESGKYIRMLEPRDLCQSVFCQIVSCPSASSRPDLCDTSWAGVVTACCWTVSQRVKG